MLRYRLYDVDRVISRSLTYALVTVGLAAAYAGLVLAGQAVFSSFAGGSDLAIAVSTLVVAALFLPLRSRVQGFVDRRFYRRRYDARGRSRRSARGCASRSSSTALRADLEGVVRRRCSRLTFRSGSGGETKRDFATLPSPAARHRALVAV